MRRLASTSFFLAAFLLPTLGLALDNQHPAMLAQTDEAHPAQRTETKPFDPHAAHAPAPSAGPWFDLSGLLPPRLADNLGKHRYAVTVANDEARAFFDQGLIYAYGFNHFEALRAFRHAQTLDPECAMCFWGEAYVLGPNLNLPMEAGAAAMARTAAENAVAKAARLGLADFRDGAAGKGISVSRYSRSLGPEPRRCDACGARGRCPCVEVGKAQRAANSCDPEFLANQDRRRPPAGDGIVTVRYRLGPCWIVPRASIREPCHFVAARDRLCCCNDWRHGAA